MKIIASATMRNDYLLISKMAHDTGEPIYVTRNGESDLVIMSAEAFEKREQLWKLREHVYQAEKERFEGIKTVEVSEARTMLEERVNE